MENPQMRPRSKSTFSFKSDKSHGSRHSKQHKDHHHPHLPHHLKESPAEKKKNHLTSTTKANPNAAMEEAQPIAAALEKPTLQSLRSFQHTDINGNIITEPDLSNPTRPRWERPLDTIKSFELAIDNEYKRRRGDVAEPMSGYASQRTSYYGHDQNRYSHASNATGLYGNRQAPVGRDSWVDNGHAPIAPVRGRYGQKIQQDQMWSRHNGGHGVYPTQAYQQSRDTVNTHGSNGSHSEPYSADPSSDNSSIERPGPVSKVDPGEQYGFTGFGGGPQFQGPILEEFGNAAGPAYGRPREEPSNANGGYFQQSYGGSVMPPPVPAKAGPSNTAAPIRLNGGGQQQQPSSNGNGNADKRKSWFKRRFSKD